MQTKPGSGGWSSRDTSNMTQPSVSSFSAMLSIMCWRTPTELKTGLMKMDQRRGRLLCFYQACYN